MQLPGVSVRSEGTRQPEIDRTRGLPVPKTKTPTSDGWRFVNDVLGGPGRNRTTDTRIFNLSAVFGTTLHVCRSKVLPVRTSLSWGVTDTTRFQTRWRIARRFCRVRTVFSLDTSRSRRPRNAHNRPARDRPVQSCSIPRANNLLDAPDLVLPHISLKITQKTSKEQSEAFACSGKPWGDSSLRLQCSPVIVPTAALAVQAR